MGFLTGAFRITLSIPVLLNLSGCSAQAEADPNETNFPRQLSKADLCAAYQDALPGKMYVRLVNASTKSLYVDGFQISDSSGVLQHSGSGCRQGSCGDLQRPDFHPGCPAIYIAPTVVQLNPGESTVEDWDARLTSEVTLPNECVKASNLPAGPANCQRYARIPSGVYTFHAVASTVISCPVDKFSTCTTCTPRAGGGCTITGIQAEPMSSASTEVTISANGTVSPGAGGIIPIPEVVLTFKD
ncbi:MAG: hypothetical protein SFV15_10305 [Polyangiaceae bacterium]|nr:hypothetical protein [Polyangiaceae bacterium]